MKAVAIFITTVALVTLAPLSRADTEDPTELTTTDTPTYATEISIENVTNSPLDNGMAINDIRDETSPFSINLLESTARPLGASSTGPVVFPDTPKNITSIEYAVSEVSRPPLNHRSKYQEPYRMSGYHAKPVKFEENSFRNVFIPPNYEKNKPRDTKVEQSQFVVHPFPYAFETNQDHGMNWYKNSENGQIDDPKGAHDSINPENAIPYGYHPHGESHKHKIEFYPQDHYNHWHNGVAKDVDYKTPWKKIAQVVTALLPLGLILATLTPSVFTVDPVSNTPMRQRSEELTKRKFTEEDVLRLLKENGVDSQSLSRCEDKALCDLARKGVNPSANSIERGFWFLANKTPDDIAQKSGLDQLFAAIKAGNCDSLQCEPRDAVETKRRIKKKIIKKRKLVNNQSSHQ